MLSPSMGCSNAKRPAPFSSRTWECVSAESVSLVETWSVKKEKRRKEENERETKKERLSPVRSTTVGSSHRVPLLWRLDQKAEAKTRTGPLLERGGGQRRSVRVTRGRREERRAEVIFF